MSISALKNNFIWICGIFYYQELMALAIIYQQRIKLLLDSEFKQKGS